MGLFSSSNQRKKKQKQASRFEPSSFWLGSTMNKIKQGTTTQRFHKQERQQ